MRPPVRSGRLPQSHPLTTSPLAPPLLEADLLYRPNALSISMVTLSADAAFLPALQFIGVCGRLSVLVQNG